MRPIFLAVCALVLAVVSDPAPAWAQPEVRIGTAPAGWVEPIPVPAGGASVDGPYEDLLDDRQIRVDGPYADRFVHRAYRLLTAAGVQDRSELVIELAGDDALDWHFIRRMRGDTTEELLGPTSVRLIQPEARLHEGLYDGRRRAIVFLEDVRPGDRIEYAYTVRRRYAMFGGRFAGREWLGAGRPIRRARLRVTWPRRRELRAQLNGIPSSWVKTNEPGALLIDTRDLPAVADVPFDAPAWHAPDPNVELSEFAGWADVAAWMTATYEEAARGGMPAAVPFDEIAAAPTLAGRVERALRFVQDDIRYLGLEMGERAVVPHPPSVVAERRFGDCKDKALLLVTILRELGVTAHPALVHTELRHTVQSRLPAPIHFDHVIVRVELDGEVLWLDATRRAERGPLAEREIPNVRRALVGRRETRDLEVVPSPRLRQPTLDIVERFEVGDAGTTFVCTTTYRGNQATDQRQRLERESAEDVLRSAVRFYEERGLSVEPTSALEVVDDEETGALRITERYHVESFWVDGKRDVSPWAVTSRIFVPRETRAPAPLALVYPMHVRHRVEVQVQPDAGGWAIAPGEQRLGAGPFLATRRVEVEGPLVAITVRAQSSGDHVPADRVDAYRGWISEVDGEIGYELIQGSPGAAQALSDGDRTWITLLCFGVPLLLVIVVFASRVAAGWWRGRRRRAFHRKQRAQRGESPESAIEVRDLDDPEQLRAPEVECCGRRAVREGWTRARYDGRPLAIHSSRCETCRARHRRYYRARE